MLKKVFKDQLLSPYKITNFGRTPAAAAASCPASVGFVLASNSAFSVASLASAAESVAGDSPAAAGDFPSAVGDFPADAGEFPAAAADC